MWQITEGNGDEVQVWFIQKGCLVLISDPNFVTNFEQVTDLFSVAYPSCGGRPNHTWEIMEEHTPLFFCLLWAVEEAVPGATHGFGGREIFRWQP